MPELGETWSFIETESTTRVEAVVIATGPSMIRLVSRTSRRITFPLSTWNHIWQFAHAAPSTQERCHKCRQIAYFRFHFEGALVWSCEDHLPHGVRALFPGDNSVTATNAGLETHCPNCESSRVQIRLSATPLSNGRMTSHCVCDLCQTRWSPVLSFGVGDDGTTLASDLYELVANDSSVLEIRMGFIAYRNLCRALGMGNVTHIGGIPLRMQHDLGDLLTLVISGSITSTEEALPIEGFSFSFLPLSITVTSTWRRRVRPRHRTAHCNITAVQGDQITYEIAGRQGTTTQSRRDFLLDWMPGRLHQAPAEASIWMQAESQQLVQVLASTPTQAAHQQVHYITCDGRRETTPTTTFQRLYRQLPAPPEDHLWYSEGTLFEVEREGSVARLKACCPPGDPSSIREIEITLLYSSCEPLIFVASGTSMRGGALWVNPQNADDTALIIDIGVLDSKPMSYVRFKTADGTVALREMHSFRSDYAVEVTPAPCRAGETWVSLESSFTDSVTGVHRHEAGRQGVILKEDDSGSAVLQWSDGTLESLRHDVLVASYRRLDVRSYWEILDVEDDV